MKITDNENGNEWGERNGAGILYSQEYARYFRHTRISANAFSIASFLIENGKCGMREEELKETFERAREIMITESNHREKYAIRQ